MPDPSNPLLRLTYSDAFEPVVEVGEGGRRAASFAELGQLEPDLPSRARQGEEALTSLLAQAYAHFGDSRQQLVLSAEALRAAIAKWAEPELSGMRRWYAGETISGPPLELLAAPAWDGEELVLHLFNLEMSGSHRYLFGQRVRLSFATEGWSGETEHLDTQTQLPLSATEARAAELFGGPVQGFLRAKSSATHDQLYLAVDRGEGALAYAWWPNRAAPSRYATFAELAAAHPEAREPKLLASLAGELETYWGDRGVRHGHFKPIEDGPAYLEDYRRQGWGTFKLRYWVDQLATWEHDVPDLETVASPRVEGETLHAFFQGDKNQPFRMALELTALSLAEAPELEAMANERLVSDTGGYHGGPKGGPKGLGDLEPPEVSGPRGGPPGVSGPRRGPPGLSDFELPEVSDPVGLGGFEPPEFSGPEGLGEIEPPPLSRPDSGLLD